MLENVCFKQGVYFAKVDARGTSQTCPSCGTHTGKKELSERNHICETCGYETPKRPCRSRSDSAKRHCSPRTEGQGKRL
ncbi:MAG: zinc ribbon domain-containing protein [Prochloraceae cyanobacterium]|nr:zinc ribbon domain-containing protein [Prochloraceae cyanobacterium]